MLELATIQKHKYFRMNEEGLIAVISLHYYLIPVTNYSFYYYINMELCWSVSLA